MMRWLERLLRRAEGGEVTSPPPRSGDTMFLTIDDQLWIKVGSEDWRPAGKPR